MMAGGMSDRFSVLRNSVDVGKCSNLPRRADNDGNDVCLDLDNVTLLVNPAALSRPLDRGSWPALVGQISGSGRPRLWRLTG